MLEIAQKTEPKKKAPEVESRPQEIGLALVPRVALLESAGCAPPKTRQRFFAGSLRLGENRRRRSMLVNGNPRLVNSCLLIWEDPIFSTVSITFLRYQTSKQTGVCQSGVNII